MSCRIDAAYDAELVTMESHRTRRARKAHKCGECQEEIKIGGQYEESRSLFDGQWTTFKTCELCSEIRQKLFCSWVWGQMWEDIAQENVFTLSLKDLSVRAIEKIEWFWRSMK